MIVVPEELSIGVRKVGGDKNCASIFEKKKKDRGVLHETRLFLLRK